MLETIEDYQSVCKVILTLNKTEYSECYEAFGNEHDSEGKRLLSGIDVEEVCDKNDKSAACTFRYVPEGQNKEVIYKYKG